MSNSKNILYLISLILLMLTGCEAETSLAPFPNEGEEPVEVRFHATTFGANMEVSRANYTPTELEEGKQIGMWGGTYQNISLTYNNINNEDENTPNLSTTDQSKIYYPLQTDTMNIYAYAPYSNEAYDRENNTILVKSEWVEEKELPNYIIDPIWAKGTTTKEQAHTNPVDLFFQHAMSRVQIYLTNEEKESYNFFFINFTFDRTQYGEMSMETGEITAAITEKPTGEYNYQLTETNDVKITLLPKNETTEPHYDHTIIPGSVLKKINIMIEQGYISHTYSFTESNKIPAFEAGKLYKIYIDFGKIEEQN